MRPTFLIAAFVALTGAAVNAQTTSVIQGRVSVHSTTIRNGVAAPTNPSGIIIRAVTASGWVQATTDAKGFFTIWNVPPGYVKLAVLNYPAEQFASGICLQPGTRIVVDMPLLVDGSLPQLNAIQRTFETSIRRSNGVLAKSESACKS